VQLFLTKNPVIQGIFLHKVARHHFVQVGVQLSLDEA
jgi:hypothetical protein